MATKTKKHRVKAVAAETKAPLRSKVKKEPFLQAADGIPLAIIFLYLFVDYVPRFEGADVMGAQWIYLSIVNVLGAAYVFIKRKVIAGALQGIGKNAATLAFTALYVLAGFSILAAMNKVEAFVVYARLTTTFFAFLTMALMLYNRMHLFRLLAQLLSIFLLLQSLDLLNQFFKGFYSMPIVELVDSLKFNSGNKNIMAASLTMKVPFALYCIFTQRLFGKFFNSTVLALGLLTIFFVNARATFLSLILIGVLLTAYLAYIYTKDKNWKVAAGKFAFFILPLVVTFSLSNMILESKLEYSEEDKGSYGAVTERLSTISLEKQSNSLRMNQYRSAVAHIKSNPLMGAGIGNWKLASIPYERSFSDEMFISYHVHNDFLEYAAELGILGGLFYLGIYIALLVMSLKVIFSKTASEKHKQMAAFALMGLAVYFIDATFNFPLERPIMQVFLGFILAIHINIYLSSRETAATRPAKTWMAAGLAGLTIVLMIPTLWIDRQVYKSMSAQAVFNADMLSGNPVYKTHQVVPALPEIPDLNVFGFPIDAIKARYYLAEKKYDSSLYYLNKSMHVNPYITYNEFLKGNLFLETQQYDSAYHYAKKAFFMKPRAKSNYQLLNAVLVVNKDSAVAEQAFYEARKFRNEPWLWNDYINVMYNIGKDFKYLFTIADSAVKQFPDSPELQQKRRELEPLQNVPRPR